ncbi:MAG: dihydrolipoamide acetyltransferase family protein [Methanomassiliicoccales archaeon]|jgi:pyruvate dehydrogenase E2 component (dihydrolipoamide acetyltransferase)
MPVEYKFPDLGEGVTEGEVKKWLVKEGDTVNQDQSIAEVETDKAVVEMPVPVSGKVLRLHFREGDIVKVGETLATIGEEGEIVAEVPTRKPSVSVVGELPEAPEETETVRPLAKTAVSTTEVLATPAVRKFAKDVGVDIGKVKGTGPGGRVTEEDVKGFSARPVERIRPRTVAKFDIYGWIDRVPLKGVRRTTAKRMVESQTKAAHVTSMDLADVTELVALREAQKKITQETRHVKLTYMPFIIKAVVESLKAHPYLNATLDEEGQEIILKKYYNIGIAVATEDGLIVPVIKGADQKNIFELAEEVQRLAELASLRKIDLADLKGGTFTITNYGVFGGTYGTPIINYPEVAILGTGKIADAPLVKDAEVKVRKTLPLSLSFDHRVLDGAEAAKFMNDVIRHLENPTLMLLSF